MMEWGDSSPGPLQAALRPSSTMKTGNLLRTILANGLKIVNTYAPSGLLERIEDNAGHYIQYFYDTEGNPIREEIHDRDGDAEEIRHFRI